MKSKNTYYIVTFAIITGFYGCKSAILQSPENESETGTQQQVEQAQTDQTQLEQTLDGNQQLLDDNQEVLYAEDEDEENKCPNGAKRLNDKCICNDGSEYHGNGWYCTINSQKCMDRDGCDFNGKHYPFGANLIHDQYLCGKFTEPDNSDGLECAYYSSTESYEWQCKKETCLCNGKSINRYSSCYLIDNSDKTDTSANKTAAQTDDSNNAKEESVNITTAQADQTDKTTKDNTTQENTDNETIHQTDNSDETEVDDNNDETKIDDNNDETEVNDNNIDECGDSWKDDKGYICENNEWVCKTEKEKKKLKSEHLDMFCEGISLSSIRYVINERSNIPYHCRYGHWVCESEQGCSCFNGNDTIQIHFGEICKNENSSCDNAKWPPNAAHIHYNQNYFLDEPSLALVDKGLSIISPDDIDTEPLDIDNPDENITKHYNDPKDVCFKDNCPCGDGACMKYGRCLNGISCRCGNILTNLHDEFYCAEYQFYSPAGDFTALEEGGILYCIKEGGCHTRDGRHYPQWTKIGGNGYNHKDYSPWGDRFLKYDQDLANSDSLMYHIDAGFDTTIESISPLGECVLDRTDNIQRFSLLTKEDNQPSEFICDQQICACGKNSCHIGEICREGRCKKDKCNAHKKSKLICDVNLKTGQRDFPDPDNPKQCIVFPYKFDGSYIDGSYYNQYLYFGWFTTSSHANNYHEELEKYINKTVNFDYSNGYSDDEIDFQEAKKQVSKEKAGKLYFDVETCKGGHRYCHGRNNPPILIPDNPKGWLCLDVNSIPAITATDHLKAWVCDNESGCLCGTETCGYQMSCIDNQCLTLPRNIEMCDNQPLKKGYQCKKIDDELLQMCSTQNKCACGNSNCKSGEICQNDQCINPTPYKNRKDIPCYGDGEFDKKDNCLCDKTKIDDPQDETCAKINNKYFILCNKPDGCDCGDTKCPMSTYCKDDDEDESKCIDPLTNNELPDSSTKLAVVKACADDECKCGKKNCQKGQFCIGGICSEYLYSNIYQGKRYFYNHYSMYKGPHPGRYYINDDNQIKDWNTIQSKNMSWIYGKMNLPTDEYALAPYYNWEWTGHSYEYDYVFKLDKFRCSISSGCTCGKNKCAFGMECINGECHGNDDIFITTYCDVSKLGGCCDDDYESHDIKVINGMCYCAGNTVHPPITDTSTEFNRYKCDNFGWYCEFGPCNCGNTVCDQGDYCIKPGVCANAAE